MYLLQFFEWEHLEGPKRLLGESYHMMAQAIVNACPPNPEQTTALRQLLNSREAGMRAIDFKSEPR